MRQSLSDTLYILKMNEAELRRQGVRHAAVFGSVARGEAQPESDIDILVELDPEREISLFDYSRVKLFLGELFDNVADVVNRKTPEATTPGADSIRGCGCLLEIRPSGWQIFWKTSRPLSSSPMV